MAEESKTAQIKTLSHELFKSYIAYDGSSRMEYAYEAPTDAADGAPCLVTQFVYDGATTRIIKRKESNATWNSSWDI